MIAQIYKRINTIIGDMIPTLCDVTNYLFTLVEVDEAVIVIPLINAII